MSIPFITADTATKESVEAAITAAFLIVTAPPINKPAVEGPT